MLTDGTILDSARLPQDAVAGHAVTMSAESLVQSRSAVSPQGHPITFSGGSIMDSGSVQAHPMSLSPGSTTSIGVGLSGQQTPTSWGRHDDVLDTATPASLQGFPIHYSASSLGSVRPPGEADRSAGQPRQLFNPQQPGQEAAESISAGLQRNLDSYVESQSGQNVHYHPIAVDASQEPFQAPSGMSASPKYLSMHKTHCFF